MNLLGNLYLMLHSLIILLNNNNINNQAKLSTKRLNNHNCKSGLNLVYVVCCMLCVELFLFIFIFLYNLYNIHVILNKRRHLSEHNSFGQLNNWPCLTYHIKWLHLYNYNLKLIYSLCISFNFIPLIMMTIDIIYNLIAFII